MPSDLSGYFGNKILRWFNNQADMPSRPAALYVALFNGNPRTTGVEVGGTINPTNERQVVTFTALASGVDHLLTSSVAVDFGNADGPTPISHVAIFDDPDPGEGNLYWAKAVNGGPASVLANSLVKFASGQITLNIGADA